MQTAIEKIASIGTEQATSDKEISEFMMEIQQMSEKLNEFAEKL
jgi:hypothetical protein